MAQGVRPVWTVRTPLEGEVVCETLREHGVKCDCVGREDRRNLRKPKHINAHAAGINPLMDGPDARIKRARLRKKIAAEVIDICRGLARNPRTANREEQTAAALHLHDAHVRHSQDLGQTETAERAEDRYARALNRLRGR